MKLLANNKLLGVVGGNQVVFDPREVSTDKHENTQRAVGITSVEYLATRTSHLWAIAIVFFGGGDLITTGIGLSFARTIEVGPLAAIAYQQSGLIAFPILKTITVGILYAIWRVTPPPHDTGVPLGLAAFGVLVNIWNLSIIIALL